MPINTPHPSYTVEAGEYTSAAYNGDVKCFVPRGRGWTDADHRAFVERPAYFNVTKRTTDALIGAMLRKPYVTTVEDPFVSEKMNFDTMLSYILRDIMLTSRVGILVDFNEELGTPYLTPYDNAAIINWGDDFVVLREDYFSVDPKDKYKKEVKCQYRELTLVDGVYTVNIWRAKGTDQNMFQIVETMQPSSRGSVLDFIPFVFINSQDTTDECHKPVMFNMAEINIAHFKSSADIEHLAHFFALPQMYIAGGFEGEVEGTLAVGVPNAWVLAPQSTVSYAQANSSGFDSLMKLIDKKEEQMASLGSRMLAKAGVESAEALKLRAAGENSILIGLVNAVEEGLKQVLKIYSLWEGKGIDEVEFYMSRDFTNLAVTPTEVSSLLALFTSGQISQETLLQRLYEGEIVDNVEEEMQRLNSQA